jgi:hypothetical protein
MYRRRAATWCELHGIPGLAFRYAYESGELAQAGRIALAHRDELARRGQSETVRLWLERCSDEEIASDPSVGTGRNRGRRGPAARVFSRRPRNRANPSGLTQARA